MTPSESTFKIPADGQSKHTGETGSVSEPAGDQAIKPPAGSDLESVLARLKAPVVLVSTIVGRGMYTLGEALRERLIPQDVADHLAIEDYLPRKAVVEDLERYKFISNRMPALLYLVYKVPVFYFRKYLREVRGAGPDLNALQRKLISLNARTVLCVSHRPAFWMSSLKRRGRMDCELWGVLGEYGNTLGWRHIFWEQMDGFLSPLDRRELTYNFPARFQFAKIDLPARRAYYRLRNQPGNPRGVLVVCGYWGQGPIVQVLREILAVDPGLSVTVVCGDNQAVRDRTRRVFGDRPNVSIHGVVSSLEPFLAACSCVITKPGISTLLETHAAGRKIFLLRGMPVAEDNNARHALRHFGAEWYSREAFRKWLRSSPSLVLAPHSL